MGNCLLIGRMEDVAYLDGVAGPPQAAGANLDAQGNNGGAREAEDDALSPALDKAISTNSAYKQFVVNTNPSDFDQRQWKYRFVHMIQEDQMTISQCVDFAYMELNSLPPIRVVDFEEFEKGEEIIRFGKGSSGKHPVAPSSEKHITLLSDVDRTNALIVFVSHCWVSGFDGKDKDGAVINHTIAKNWREYPHPDNKENDKYKLIVEAIKYIWKHMAPGMRKCYIWKDFSCMDQNGNPAGELKQLDKIVEACDCMLTPVVDPEHNEWERPSAWSNHFKDYAAKSFCLNSDKFAYMNRPWCRVEMLYAANIPISEEILAGRIDKFAYGLKSALEQHVRAHYVFGNKEAATRRPPLQLPPMANSHLKELAPDKVIQNLTSAADADKIKDLMASLRPYLHKVEQGYEGEKNSHGQRHGQGTYQWANGAKYSGAWANNVKSGYGVNQWATGTHYAGHYLNDERHGTGKIMYCNGDSYDGEWIANRMDGEGVFTWVTGATYKGTYRADNKHGYGVMTFADGGLYEGLFENNTKNGKGKYTWATGTTFDGMWINDKKNGMGTMTWPSGTYYTGNYENNKRCGEGVMSYPDGGKYEGGWLGDKRHGQGKYFYTSGDTYEGDYFEGKQHGTGTFTWSSGTRYVGQYVADQRTGYGTITFANGSSYTGDWVDGLKKGAGVYEWESGTKYSGQYDNDSRTGRGTMEWSNGNVYEGDWLDNKQTGRGIFKFNNGDVYEGQFLDDKRHGRGVYAYASGGKYVGDYVKGKHCGRGVMNFANGEKYDGDWVDGKRCGKGIYQNADGSKYQSEWKDDKRVGEKTPISC